MKSIKLLTTCLVLLTGLAYTASGATNGVVVGQNFQSVIDASAPGDTLVVQLGIYPDASLVFNKPLTVLPSSTNGDWIQLLGAIQVTGAGTSSFQHTFFGGSVQTMGATVGFFGGYFDGTVQTTGAAVSFFDSTFNSNVTVTGSSVTMKRTTLNYPLTLSGNAAMVALRMTNNAAVTATATVGANTPFLAVQSSFSQPVSLSSYNVWLGYNYFSTYGILRQTNCNSILMGNKLNITYMSPAIIYSQGGTLKAHNNFLSCSVSSEGYGQVYGIYLSSNVAEVVNNTFSMYCGGNYPATTTGIGLDAGGPLTVRGNVIYTRSYSPVTASGSASQMIFVSYCAWNGQPSGVTPPLVNCLSDNGLTLSADGSLPVGSPYINAGPPDAIYNNRDGTRNTMGYTGGPYWNPANYTNNNPMVFFLGTSQQVVLSGIQTNIPVSTAASAGH